MHSAKTNVRAMLWTKNDSTLCRAGGRFGLLKFATAVICGLLLVAAARPAQAQTESVLYSFCSEANCVDGAVPNPNLILDADGNLYGTTAVGGGAADGGVAFEITPDGVETVLHNFNSFDTGFRPMGGLIRDGNGNFYGTTSAGGFGPAGHSTCRVAGCGLVFELTPTGTETILFAFYNHQFPPYEGTHPYGSLIHDAQGNLYGTADGFGAKTAGAVFAVTANGGESVMHWFGSYTHDGKFVNPGLVMDSQGNVFGTTSRGGGHNVGTVFEINAAGVESVLYSFGTKKSVQNGSMPSAGLVLDAAGNLYGTTASGGASANCSGGCGTVFQVTPAGAESVLYSFTGSPDGAAPKGTLIMDGQGNLYGTTQQGGVYGFGSIFKVTPTGQETILHSFAGGADGAAPYDGLVMDAQGNLYGSTSQGGNSNSFCNGGCGIVFKVTP